MRAPSDTALRDSPARHLAFDSPSSSLSQAVSALFLSTMLGIDRLTRTCAQDHVAYVASKETPCVDVRAMQQIFASYLATIFAQLSSEYSFDPGVANPVRDVVKRYMATNPNELMSFLQEQLPQHRGSLTEDVKLETINAICDYVTQEFRNQVAHLCTKLLTDESAAIVDSAAIALSADRLNARQATKFVRAAADRAKGRFLKKQLTRVADELNADAAPVA